MPIKLLLMTNMAPVTGGIADGKEDGPVFCFCFFKGFITPGIPVHWIIGVFQIKSVCLITLRNRLVIYVDMCKLSLIILNLKR